MPIRRRVNDERKVEQENDPIDLGVVAVEMIHQLRARTSCIESRHPKVPPAPVAHETAAEFFGIRVDAFAAPAVRTPQNG